MRKLLNKPWFVILLALGAVGAAWYSLAPYFTSPQPPPPPPPEPAAVATENTVSSEDSSALPEPAKAIPQTKVSRDPFVVKKASSEQAAPTADTTPDEPDVLETFRVSALWTQHGSTLVYINGQVHQVGDNLGRVMIESATPQGVWLSNSQGREFVQVGKQLVLRTPGRSKTKSPSQTTP